ncbi:hypothetical protein PSHT_02857 [Puccinia striiformis]|uniref:Phosphatidylinositol-specific phospholipase C X domain-containing protein n=1 Tax=Puccinia striiformis TaxID=27350 RepID=A0A2S4WH52_9BASI|nr:hypothetical protein PSHT_02857 [Puccinia striiformis]
MVNEESGMRVNREEETSEVVNKDTGTIIKKQSGTMVNRETGTMLNYSQSIENTLSSPQPLPGSKCSSLRTCTSTSSIRNLASATLQFTTPFTQSAIKLILENHTTSTIRIVQWPTKFKKLSHLTTSSYHLSPYRGTCFNPQSIPPIMKEINDRSFTIGEIDKPTGLFESSTMRSSNSRVGWIYFDLIKPDGYILHLQIYVKLTRNNGAISSALLGRFDLDSSPENPMPSGFIGDQIEITGSSTDLICFKIHEFDIQGKENTVDDTPLKPPLGVPTKRLSTFSFVSHPLIILSFRVGKDARYHEFQPSTSRKITVPKFTRSDHILSGINSLKALLFIQHSHIDNPILHRSASINPLSGLVYASLFLSQITVYKLTPSFFVFGNRSEGDKVCRLVSTMETKSIFLPDLNLSISYGFHDSRMGKRHSLYAYATPNYSSWLGDLIDQDQRWLEVRFSKLVLQGSHDSGMFTSLHPGFVKMITKMKLDSDIGNFLIDHGISFVHILTKLLKTFNIELELAICNIANTQKDVIFDQLRLGARFFDFRPGYCFHDCLNGERGKIYHQHACVPGYEYIKALEETFSFLVEHPREIVVFELKSDGFIARKTTWRKDSVPFHSMIPTKAALQSSIDKARKSLEKQLPEVHRIEIGGPSDLDRPIGDLLHENIRFIIIHRMGDVPEQGWDWERDDSYDHVLYDTDRPDDIIKALDLTHARNSVPVKQFDSKPSTGTIYQLQATPTKSIADDIITSLTYSKASSLLVYTKANLDPFTYSWVKGRHFIEPGLVVLLNDFVDSALTEHAIEKSKIRAGLFSSL